MKNSIITFSLCIIIFSCADNKKISTGLEGVWNRIGTINYDAKGNVDTIPFPNINERVLSGKQFKVYTSNYFTWLRNSVRIDSTGKDNDPGTALHGKYEIKNDTLIEYVQYGADQFMSGRGANPYETNWVPKFIVKIYGDKYEQIWTNKRADGSYRGELYQKIDGYNKIDKFSGVWERVGNILNKRVVEMERFSNFSIGDTISWEDFSSLNNISNARTTKIFTDNYQIHIVDGFRPDSLGKDSYKERSFMTSTSISGDTLASKYFFGTQSYESSFKKYGDRVKPAKIINGLLNWGGNVNTADVDHIRLFERLE